MKHDAGIRPSDALKHVRYEIRGALARRAIELERQGYEIISLNIGNPGAYGFRTPEILRLALVQNLPQAEGYAYQKGVYPAREAILLQQQNRGIRGGTTETIFIGNGTSELIDQTLPYHAPCQLRAHRVGRPALDILELIPGLNMDESNAACCGLAGSYGYKAERYQIAMDVGAGLFDFMRASGSDTAVCDSEICRWQIAHGSGLEMKHPIEILREAYG